jgi:oxygen-independent coproporphyrinogen III oxidase
MTMRIAVQRLGFADFQTEIYHICKLFFEEVVMEYIEENEPSSAQDGDAAYRLTIEVLRLEDEGTIRAVARLIDTNGESCSRENLRSLRMAQGSEDQRRVVKRAVGSALLQVLQDYTGMEQPWGILTGVRPTKLFHNLMQNKPIEECQRELREQYLVSESKVKLLSDIAERQLRVIPDLFELDREVSVYIGIPFCPTKCAYCTFPAYDIRGQNGSVAAFLEGLHVEIRAMGEWLRQKGLKVTTMYWGGGTPTSIEAHEMDALFQTLHESFPDMGQLRELTVEAGRPDTITPDKIEVMKKWKVDRISINPQSFTQGTLDAIGRHHTVTETIDKFQLARQMGMNNINMDLIIGLPNEGVEEFRHTLEETAKLLPESLTVHTLSFKRASRMTQNRDSYEVAERDEVAEMIQMTEQWTLEHAYVPYYMYRQKNILGNQENVGYSFDGKESLYNILMMEDRQTIIGLGCGAVSKFVYPSQDDGGSGEHLKIERFPNPKEPAVYNRAYKEYIEKKIAMLNEIY